MKKQKNKLNLFMIIGIVLLVSISLGTAIISSILSIKGNTTIKENSWVIYFDSIRVSTDSVESEENAKITDHERTRIDFTANLKEPGDLYEFTVYTVNDGSIDAMVDSVEKFELSEEQQKYLDFQVTYDNGKEIKRCDELDSHTRRRVKALVKFKEDLEIGEYPSEDVNLELFFNINYVQKQDSCPREENPNERILTIKPNGGVYKGRSDETRIYLEKENTYTVEEATRFLYNFKGWKVVEPEDESEGTFTFENGVFTMGDEDVTIEAEWEEGDFVARIMNTYYRSVQSAIDAVDGQWDDNTVYLLKNVTENPENSARNPFTFNLGGYKITGQMINPTSGNIRLINGKIQSTTEQNEAFINYGTLTMGIQGDGVQVENSISLIGQEVGLRNIKENGSLGVFNFYDGYIEGNVGLLGGYTDKEEGYYVFSEHISERNVQRIYLVKTPSRAIARTETGGTIYYYNLQDAINLVELNKVSNEFNDEYKIFAVRSFDAAYEVNVSAGKSIVFDMLGYTMSTGNAVTVNGAFKIMNSLDTTSTIKTASEITNNGRLVIDNINLSATNAKNVINNNAQLEMTNTNIQSASGYGVDNRGTGTISLDSKTSLSSTHSYGLHNVGTQLEIDNGNIYGIYNESGSITLKDNVKVHNGDSLYALYNKATAIIAGGEISDASINYVINNENGTMTITGGIVRAQNTAIRNASTLLINGGNISSTNGTTMINSSNTITITDGNITSENGVAINNSGIVNVNGGTIQSETDTAISGNSTVNVTAGTITAEKNAISTATANISGGTITGGETGVNSTTSIISGGTITGTNYGIQTGKIEMTNGNVNSTEGTAILVKTSGTITGGTIFGENYGVYTNKALTIGEDDEIISQEIPKIIGGFYGLYIESGELNFYDGILEGITDGYFGEITGVPTGTRIVEGTDIIGEKEYKTDTLSGYKDWLQVGEEKFNNLDDASQAVADGGTILVIDDAEITFIQHISKENTDKNITIDLQGHNVTTTQSIYNYANVEIIDSSANNSSEENANSKGTGTIVATKSTGIINEVGASMTIEAGHFRATASDNSAIENRGTLTINNADIAAVKNGVLNYNELIINDVNIHDSENGIVNNTGSFSNSYVEGEIVIYAGTINANNIGISLSSGKSVDVHGGYIYGVNSGISGSRSAINIHDGTITSTDSHALYTYTGTITVHNGTITSENSSAIDSHSDIVVNNGEIKGTIGINNEAYCNAYGCYNNNVTINGGHIVGTTNEGIITSKLPSGKLSIFGGTIEGKTTGVHTTMSAEIGKDDGEIHIDSPIIIGHSEYGLITETYTAFYDGILKGINDGYYGLISIIPDSTIVKEDIEYIEKKEYQIDYLSVKGNWLRVGSQEFNSINKAAELIKQMPDKTGTMTVIADAYVNFAQEIPEGLNVIFDFNGHSLIMTQPLETNGNVTFVNNSENEGGINNIRDVTIKNNGKMKIMSGTFHSDTSSTINSTNELIMNGGEVISENSYAINNTSKFILYGGKITSKSSNAALYTNNGTVTIEGGTITGNNSNGISQVGGTLTINNGTITSESTSALQISSGNATTTDINGGEIIGQTYGIQSSTINNELTINGGHIRGLVNSGLFANAKLTKILGGTIEGNEYGVYASSKTIIGENDGTINIDAPILKGDLYGLFVTTGTDVAFNDGIIKGISGRHNGVILTLADKAEIFEDEEVINEQNYLTEYLVTQTEVAINVETGEKYGNLQTALDDAEPGQTVKLLTNVPMYYELNVAKKQNVTLDLDGKTISTNKKITVDVPFAIINSSDKDAAIKISTAVDLITNNSTLTIDNVTLKNSSSSNYVVNNASKLTLNETTIESINGVQNRDELTITDSNIKATKIAINNQSKLTINGGTYEGNTYSMYSNSQQPVKIDNATFNGVYYNSGNNIVEFNTGLIKGSLQNYTSNMTVNESNITKGSIANNGTLTINNSEYKSTVTGAYYYSEDIAVSNSGTMTINESNILVNTEEQGRSSVAISNSGTLNVTNKSNVKIGMVPTNYSYKAITTTNSGTTTIDDSTVYVNGGVTSYGIYVNDDNAKVLITTGTIKVENASTSYGAYIEKGVFEMGIEDGKGTEDAAVSTTDPVVYAQGNSRGIGVKKTNGSFNFYDGIIWASKFAKPEVPTNVEHGYEATTYFDDNTGYEYSILEWMEDDYQGDTVALLNNVYYKTVQEAIDKAEPGDEILLLKSVVEDLTVIKTKDVKLDLNKHSITTTLTNKGKFQVYNGSLQGFDNTTVINTGTFIMGEDDGNISSSSLRIISEAVAIENKGTLEVYDGYIEGTTAVDGKIDVIARFARIRREVDAQTEKKYIQSLSEEAIKNGETDLILTIDPALGYYEGSREIREIYLKYNDTYTLQTPTKNGCEFIGWDVSDPSALEGDVITIDISDITVTAKWKISESAVAKIGNEYFLKLQDALDYASEGDLVELIKDTTENVVNESNVTIDLGTHKVTGAFVNKGDLTLINGVIENPDGIGLENRKSLTLGENDEEVSTDSVQIIGTTMGIQQDGRFRFYDGFLEGEVGLSGKIDTVPKGYFLYIDHNSIKNCQRVYLIGNPENAVAVIENGGTQYFFRLQDAIDTATITKDEIFVIKDFEASYPITVKEKADIVINMSGFTMYEGTEITNNGKVKIYDTSDERGSIVTARTITNNGTLSIDNVNVSASTTNIDTFINTGTLTTKNTTITSQNGYSINTTGDLQIGENTELKANTYSIYNNQTIPLKITTGKIECITNITDLILDGDVEISTLTNNAYGIYVVGDNSTITINNATINTVTNNIYTRQKNTQLTINDGYFKSTGAGSIHDNLNTSIDADKSKFTINGGTFEAQSNVIAVNGNYLNINGGTIISNANWDGYYGVVCYGNTTCNIKNAKITSERGSGIYIDTNNGVNIENLDIYAGSNSAYGIRIVAGKEVNIKNSKIRTPRTSSLGISINNDYSEKTITLEENEINSGNIGIHLSGTIGPKKEVIIKSGYIFGDTYGVYEEGDYSSLIIGAKDSNSKEDPIIKGTVCAMHKVSGSSSFYSGKLVGIACGFDKEFNAIKSGMEIAEDKEANEDNIKSKTTSVQESAANAESGKPKENNGYALITYLGEQTESCTQNQTYEFEYKGNEDTMDITCAGPYKLEVWGAQGGSYSTTSIGGFGGYSKGEIILNEGETLYINVGGQGSNSIGPNLNISGGYNGGGDANSKNYNARISSGGGATHIATKSGLLSSLENNKQEILIVAGGGGGSVGTYTRGGSGGGYIGGKGTNYNENSNPGYYSSGGTQTEGGYFTTDIRYGRGSFGQGGNSESENDRFYGAGGGGGYYGGAATASLSESHAAGGGSGYTANPRITNQEMVGYKVYETPEDFVINYLVEKEAFLEVGKGEDEEERKKFSSLNEAVDYIAENLDGTGIITVIKDAESSEKTTIPAGQNITLDLNNKELIITQPLTNDGELLITDLSDEKGGVLKNILTNAIKNNTTLTIKDVEINNPGFTAIDLKNENEASSTIENTTITGNVGIEISRNHILKMTNSTINSNSYGIYINSWTNKITLENTTVTSSNSYAFCNEYGNSYDQFVNNIKITGGTYTGKTHGMVSRASDTEIDNATIITTSSNRDHYALVFDSFGRKMSITGDTKLIAKNASGLYTTTNLDIDGLIIEASYYGIRYPTNSQVVTTNIKNINLTSDKYGIMIDDYNYGNSKMYIESGNIYGKEYGINLSCLTMELFIGNPDANLSTTDPIIEGEKTGLIITNGKANFYGGRIIGEEKSYVGEFNNIRKGMKVYTLDNPINQDEPDKTRKESYLTENAAFLQVGDDPENTFNTFEDAMESIKDITTATITVLNDNLVYEKITIPAGKTITINLNNKNLTLTQTIINEGNLTIQGGNETYDNIITNKMTDGISNEGTLTINNATINTNSTAIRAKKNTNQIKLINSSFSGTDTIYLGVAQKLTVENCSINATETGIRIDISNQETTIKNTKINSSKYGMLIYGSSSEIEITDDSIIQGDNVGIYRNTSTNGTNRISLKINDSKVIGVRRAIDIMGTILETSNSLYESTASSKDEYAVVCSSNSECNIGKNTEIVSNNASGMYISSTYPTTITDAKITVSIINGYGIYHNFGTLNLEKGAIIESTGGESFGIYQATSTTTTNINGGSIHSKNIGIYLGCASNNEKTLNINKGTIIGETYGVSQTCSNVTTSLGNLADEVSTTDPYVEGGLISINKTAGLFNFNSGMLKGYVRGTPETVDSVREGYEIFDDQEDVQQYIKGMKTFSVTESSETATQEQAKEGNGYAKITYIEFDKTKETNKETELTNIIGNQNTNSYNFEYTGTEQIYTIPKAGRYKLEVWGAQGGYRASSDNGGTGGYSSGIIELEKKTNLYIYVGGSGKTGGTTGGFNGGGRRTSYPGGGGASDIRINSNSLYARVIVAGGGGSDGASHNPGGFAGGLIGQSRTDSYGTGGSGGTQTQAGEFRATFGNGGSGIGEGNGYAGAGGGGWYGGGGSTPDASGDDDRGGGGGSGYVYTEQTAENYPNECLLNSSYYLTETELISGNGRFMSPKGITEKGHKGDGYVRITYLGDNTNSDIYEISLSSNYGTIAQETYTYSANDPLGNIPQPTLNDSNYKFVGWYLDTNYTKKVTESTTVNSDAELYAKFVKTDNSCKELVGEETTFNYTGTEDTKRIECPGKYKLEVWGAQGGSTQFNNFTNNGGYGGYTTGDIILTTGEVLYINVGGKGNSVNYNQSAGTYVYDDSYGYNGGGYAAMYPGVSASAGGGGATHIATKSGLLKDLSSFKESLLIVAGGGGGAATHQTYPNYSGDGGSGGGAVAGSGIQSSETCYNYGTGGTQSGIGTFIRCKIDGRDRGGVHPDDAGFGKGANYNQNYYAYNYAHSGGGGGYYGGQSGWHGAGGGGSGYASGSKLDNIAMYGYNVEEAYIESDSKIAYLVEKKDFVINIETDARYLNLQEAIDKASNGDTLQLIANDFISYDISVPQGKNITIDMNGFSIVTSKQIINNGTLTITNENTKEDSISKISNNSSSTLIDNKSTLNLYNVEIEAYNVVDNNSFANLTLNKADINGRNQGIINKGKMTIDDSVIYGYAYGIYSNSETYENINNTVLQSSQNAYYKFNIGQTTITESTFTGPLNNGKANAPIEVTNSKINNLVRNGGIMNMTDNEFSYDPQIGYAILIHNNGILTLENNIIEYKNTTTVGGNYNSVTLENLGTVTSNNNKYYAIYDYDNSGEFINRYRSLYTIKNYSLLTSTNDEFTVKGGGYMYGIYNQSSNNSTITDATFDISYGSTTSYGIYIDYGNITFDKVKFDINNTGTIYGLYMRNFNIPSSVTGKNLEFNIHDTTSTYNAYSYGAYIENGEFTLESGKIMLSDIYNGYGIYLNSAEASYTQGVFDGRGTDKANVSIINPYISVTGTNYGLGIRQGDGTFNFFDGYIVGSTKPREDADITTLTELNYQVVTHTDSETGYNYCILEYNK